jgi:CheY-like chemotaxis protein
VSKVLIVDDNRSFRQLSAELLRLDGHEVLTAANGRETRRLLRSERPEIVLLDIMMPGDDGYAVCRQIKSDPATADTMVVVITALPREARYKSLQAGADAHLSKPIASRDLRALVNRLSQGPTTLGGSRPT